jgi:glycosyltransferase involved in cell wall biosynthesis
MSDQDVQILAERRAGQPSRVTVAISLYNYRRYIAACLDSVRDQTLAAVDLVVVDDCSRDGSGDEVRSWLDTDRGRFASYALLRHRENRGLAGARNTAFEWARSEYVFVLDADNLLYPRCLEQLVRALDLSAASFAYSYLEKFGAAVGLQNLSPWRPASFQDGNIIDAMVLLRHEIWKAVGGYSSQMPAMGWEDFDLWFKIARNGGWGIQVPEILGRYFVHADSMIETVTNPKADQLWQYLRQTYPERFKPYGN